MGSEDAHRDSPEAVSGLGAGGDGEGVAEFAGGRDERSEAGGDVRAVEDGGLDFMVPPEALLQSRGEVPDAPVRALRSGPAAGAGDARRRGAFVGFGRQPPRPRRFRRGSTSASRPRKAR